MNQWQIVSFLKISFGHSSSGLKFGKRDLLDLDFVSVFTMQFAIKILNIFYTSCISTNANDEKLF